MEAEDNNLMEGARTGNGPAKENDGDRELLAAVNDVTATLNLFFNDYAVKALANVELRAQTSFYHATGKMLFHFMQALFTFEPTDRKSADEAIKAASKLCNAHRHPSSITNNALTKLVVHPDYRSYTQEEIHAEVCAAECLLVRALLTFIEDGSLLSFIGGGIRLRTCFRMYKECEYMMEHGSWQSAQLKEHFESGVYLGLGMFNLIISSLPKRVLKLLEFIGFSGDRNVAMSFLEAGHNLARSFRGPLCTILNLFYHVSVRYLLGKEVDDFGYFDNLITGMLDQHPRGSHTSYLAARLQTIRGNVEDAISILTASISGHEIDLDYFRYPDYWELCFCNIIIGQYRTAADYVEILRESSNWSKAIYTYLRAAILSMCDDLSTKERQEIAQLMEVVPSQRQRIVGKSLPSEKFVAIKSRRFLAQDNWLLLPAYEAMYCFSYFLVIKGKLELLDKILAKVNRALEELQTQRHLTSVYYMDNYCLALFLKGVCLSYMGSPLAAQELFLEVYENEKSLKEERYLVSCTLLELGLINEQLGNYGQAVHFLNEAKKQTLFYTEFRIHQSLQDIKRKMAT